VEFSLLGSAFRVPYSLILFLAALLATLLLTPLVRALALRLGALDHPGPRRVHHQAVPSLGGLAMGAAVLGVAWASYFTHEPVRALGGQPLIGLTLASVVMLAVGIVDDIRGLSPTLKLGGQAIAAAVLVLFGFGIPSITTPFGDGEIPTGVFDVALTIGWVLLVTNAINLIDGLDGLAAGAVLIAAMTLWWVGRSHADLYVMFLTACLAGSTLGFLRYNFPPARIFMGDTGSQFLGVMLAGMSLLENRKGTTTITLLFPLVAMGVPIVDSVLAFVRRVMSRRPPFRADSEHIHHRLLRIGLPPRTALLVLWYLCVYLGVMAVVVEVLPRHYSWLVLALLAMGLFLAFEVLEFVDRRRARAEDGDAGRPL
jgi:UDP-GlcNAc:undecaprenyl-phosphate GlcNAc-1-phosphate transferase